MANITKNLKSVKLKTSKYTTSGICSKNTIVKKVTKQNTIIHNYFFKRSRLLTKSHFFVIGSKFNRHSSLNLLRNWNWKFLPIVRDVGGSTISKSQIKILTIRSNTTKYKHFKYSRDFNNDLKFSRLKTVPKSGITNKKLFYNKKSLYSKTSILKTSSNFYRKVTLVGVSRSFPKTLNLQYLNMSPKLNGTDFLNSNRVKYLHIPNLPEIFSSITWNWPRKLQLRSNIYRFQNSNFFKLNNYVSFLQDYLTPYGLKKGIEPKSFDSCDRLQTLSYSKPLNLRYTKQPITYLTTNNLTLINLKNHTYSSNLISSKSSLNLLIPSFFGEIKTSPTPKFRYTLLQTKHKLNFTFLNLSLFLSSIHAVTNFQISQLKFKWRKKINSFIQPNEYKNSIFFRKKKSFINSLFRNQNIYNSNYSYTNSILRLSTLYNKQTNLLYRKLNLSLNKKINTNHSGFYTRNYGDQSKSLLFNYKLGLNNYEARVTRVRFKPGYQNIWRRVRGALKDYLGLKYIYQQQLTKYLSKFYVSSTRYLWGCSEMSIRRIILYSRLLPDQSSLDLFWSKKYIFLNGLLPINQNTILSPGDIIQLVISINYYVISRWLNSLTKNRTSKFRRLVYKKGLSRKYKVIKQRKQKSYYTPSWIYKNRFDFFDTKNFLEVDYFTLSAIVLYTPYLLNYHAYDNQLDLKINTFRLYNWKYIT